MVNTECPICYEFNTGRIMHPCLHTICIHCSHKLSELFENVHCPMCRRDVVGCTPVITIKKRIFIMDMKSFYKYILTNL